MIQTRNRKNQTAAALLAAATMVLPACGGSGGSADNTTPPPQAEGLLKQVRSGSELLDAMKSGLNREAERAPTTRLDAAPDFAAEADTGGATGSPTDFSTTYTVEASVDEFDRVKYNGSHLFIASELRAPCCEILPEPAPLNDSVAISGPQNTALVRILATDPDAASATQVNTIEVGENSYVQGLYLIDQQLAVLHNRNRYGAFGDIWLDAGFWVAQETALKIYNVSDIDSPALQWDIALQGGFVDSRRIGNTMYFVTRHTPQIDGYIYYPQTVEQRSNNQQLLDELSLEDIVPTVTINGDSQPMFSASDCFITNENLDQQAAGYPVITSITAVPLNNPAELRTLCYNENAVGSYLSTEAIYLTDVRYAEPNADGSRDETTRIHKFALDGTQASYRGSAEVEGYLWAGGQNDFRISEHNDQLRIVTSKWTGDETDREDHQLFVLQESATELALEEVSRLPNSSRPQELGKANEALYGVRFQAERAYLVTFERIDPLYVIDLSDSSDPKIAGELEVPGFSNFLHPVSDELLLGLGTLAAPINRVKLELFNVADINNPVSLGSEIIGAEGAYSRSEAEYNRHAFSYLANSDGVDRFAIPVTTNGRRAGNYFNNTQLNLFEIANKTTPNAATLNPVGLISASPKPADQNWYPSNNRSVIHNEAVYFISGDAVWSALWGSTDSQIGPQ